MKLKTRTTTDARATLITNTAPSSHGAAVHHLCKGADELCICIAYLKLSGLTDIAKMLDAAIASKTKLRIMVGTDQYVTDPKALWELLRRVSGSTRATAYLVQPDSKNTFHPKLIYAIKGNTADVLVGSANLTHGGMAANVEASIRLRLASPSILMSSLTRFIDSILADTRTVTLNAVSIGQYEARHAIFQKHRRKAERQADKESSSLFALNERKLMTYLAEYLADLAEQDNRKRKNRNYGKAEAILDRLVSLRSPTPHEFLRLYEKLVGRKGLRGLWHSGGLFRSRNAVAKNAGRFVAMLKALKADIGLSPETVFDTALSHKQSIHGLGPNVITEILNTYAPAKYAVLNENPLGSLAKLGFTRFTSPISFTGEKYRDYCDFMHRLSQSCGLKDLRDLDHFMNFIYWKYARKRSQQLDSA